MENRAHLDPADRLLAGLSRGLETLWAKPRAARPYPATATDDASFDDDQRRQSGRYMRVNHVGEICAQALYHSQAVTAQDEATRVKMEQAAREEVDHLAWCEERLAELDTRKSLLNPLWYAGSFAIGAVAGIAGNRWNLGFVAETERQVVRHLEGHLGKLPENDRRSREVVRQMQADEASHAEMATAAGAAELPGPVRGLMNIASGVMTRTAHWI